MFSCQCILYYLLLISNFLELDELMKGLINKDMVTNLWICCICQKVTRAKTIPEQLWTVKAQRSDLQLAFSWQMFLILRLLHFLNHSFTLSIIYNLLFYLKKGHDSKDVFPLWKRNFPVTRSVRQSCGRSVMISYKGGKFHFQRSYLSELLILDRFL